MELFFNLGTLQSTYNNFLEDNVVWFWVEYGEIKPWKWADEISDKVLYSAKTTREVH